MKVISLVLFLAYSLCYQTAFCQQSSADSLEALLSNATAIDTKVALYQALITEYLATDPDKAIEYSNQVLKLLSYSKYIQRGKIYHNLGNICAETGQNELALSFSDSTLSYFERAGNQEEISIAKEQKWKISRNLASFFLYKDLDKASEYAYLSLKMAFQNNNLDYVGKSYNIVASIYTIKRHMKDAFMYFDSSIYYFKKTKNQEELARVYYNIGSTNNLIYDYNEASKWLYKSLEIYDSLDIPFQVAYTLSSLAAIDGHLKNYPEAIKKILRAIKLHKKNDRLLRTLTLNLGNTYCRAGEWEKAIPHLNEVISLFKELNDYPNLIAAYCLIASALTETNQLELAQQSITNALELKEYADNQVQVLGIYTEQAELFFLTKDYSQSITLFTMVLDSIKQRPNLRLQEGAIKGLILNYTATKNFRKAFDFSTKLLIVNDSLIAQNNQRNIKDIEIKYNTDKKEQENKLLRIEKELQAKDLLRNKQLFYLSIGFAFLILIISILVLRQYKLTSTATNSQLKSRLLRNQMSPHFLFNSLVAIQSFVYTNNPIKAGDYLSSFASLMRAILDNSSQEYITIEKELQWLENYLGLQLLRFSHKFEYHIDLDQGIQVEEVLIPPMLIQPFIENALEHGLKNLDKKGLLSIRIQQIDEDLLIEVDDNGLGMSDIASDPYKKHQSRALIITKERLKFLNKKQTKKIDFDIKSSPNNGTLVSFQIPFKSKF